MQCGTHTWKTGYAAASSPDAVVSSEAHPDVREQRHSDARLADELLSGGPCDRAAPEEPWR